MKEFSRLVETIKALRDPETGCPWDLKQTHKSLTKYLIEETYEYIHAVESEDDQKMCEELGDVLLQVVLHSQVAKDRHSFDIEQVSKTIADKMIRRHPHVFDRENSNAKTAEEVTLNWEKIKKTESGEESYFISEKENIMPALLSAYHIGRKSKKVNFDWDEWDEVAEKVEEEWDELMDELDDLEDGKDNKDKVFEEYGDLLFSMAQLGRHLEIDPEEALRAANNKFIQRFKKVEDMARQRGKEVIDTSRQELENIWQSIKKK